AAWVAMVLVDGAARGRGVGTALMRHALAFLDGYGVRSVRLDATALGRPLYEKLGFAAEYTLTRYQGVPRATDEGGPDVEPVNAEQMLQVAKLDLDATRIKRGTLLMRLFEETPDAFRMVRREGVCLGFLASRPGTNATQLGPLVAGEEAAARALLADAARRL